MIESIPLLRLRNSEYLQFMKNVVSLVNANDPTALNVAAQVTHLETETVDLETLFKLSQASELSQEILILDSRRDVAINGIKLMISGYALHFNPQIVQSANRLEANLDIYGSEISRQNYQAETAIINGIINDWETKPELQQAVALLNLTDWKNELKAANLLFNEKYLQRTQEYGAASTGTITSERERINGVYYALKDRIAALNTLETSEGLQKTIKELNALIEQYHQLIRNRVSENENETPSA